MNMGLAVVTVNKDALLSKLRANRNQHREEFIAAERKYRLAAVQEFKRLHDAACDATGTPEDGKALDRGLKLPKPEDHTDDYERVIEMVDMSVAPTIELTAQEFTQYVRDDWGWKAQFASTASYYK